MQLVDITSENWEDVIFLTTNETITVNQPTTSTSISSASDLL